MDKQLARAILDGRFEETELGLFVPSERMLVQGRFQYHKQGELDEVSDNLVVTEGLNYLVGVALKAVTPATNWYIGIFSGDVTVQATWTAANVATNATEITAYDEVTRGAWTGGSVAAGAVNSYAAKAEFTADQDAVVVRGAFMVSNSAKGGTGGTLLGASKFPSAKGLDTGEVLSVGYGLQLTPV